MIIFPNSLFPILNFIPPATSLQDSYQPSRHPSPVPKFAFPHRHLVPTQIFKLNPYLPVKAGEIIEAMTQLLCLIKLVRNYVRCPPNYPRNPGKPLGDTITDT